MINRENKLKVTCLNFTLVLLTALISLSCATKPEDYKEIDEAVKEVDFPAAVEVIQTRQRGKRAIYSQRNAIMLFLDKGLLEHYSGNYATSSDDLQNAERLIEEAYTKSITQGFLSYIGNDNSREYPGEDFEDIYINIFNALNYYNRGDIEGALVEVRKLSISNGKLDLLARKYDYKDPSTGAGMEEMARKEGGTAPLPEKKPVNFSNSALARYLTALFYLSDRNTSSARIEFEQLQRAYNANKNIYSTPIPKAVSEVQNIPAGKARLNIISFTGLSPVKIEEKISYSIPLTNGIQTFDFRLPKLVKRPNLINKIEVVVNGNIFELELLEDMSAVIEETFVAHYSSIVIKTYIRTMLKYASAAVGGAVVAEKQGALAGALVGLAAKITMEATERADIRMSRYLPDKAYIGGINLDAGTYSVIINYYNDNNIVSSAEYKDIEVKQQRLNLLESVILK